jgi:hypothetical protein
MGVSTGV